MCQLLVVTYLLNIEEKKTTFATHLGVTALKLIVCTTLHIDCVKTTVSERTNPWYNWYDMENHVSFWGKPAKQVVIINN